MLSRVRRTVLSLFVVLFFAVSAYAGPQGRNESGDWLIRQISRIVHQLKNIVLPFDETDPVPPHP